MRNTIAALLLSISCPALVAETYESKSKKYSLAITDELVGGYVRYEVRVIDLATGREFAFPELLASRGGYVESRMREGGVRLRIWIKPRGESISADLSVTKAGVENTLHTVWNSSPPIVRLNIEDVLRIDEGITPPVALTRVDPQYPDSARAHRISGTVIVEAIVDKSGVVKDAVLVNDLPYGIGLAALDAVKQWRFAPATRDGEPVDVVMNLTVNFRVR